MTISRGEKKFIQELDSHVGVTQPVFVLYTPVSLVTVDEKHFKEVKPFIGGENLSLFSVVGESIEKITFIFKIVNGIVEYNVEIPFQQAFEVLSEFPEYYDAVQQEIKKGIPSSEWMTEETLEEKQIQYKDYGTW